MAKHKLTAGEFTRRVGSYLAGYTAGFMGHLGAWGVALGSGDGYTGKLYDGLVAAPRLVEYGEKVYKDAERILQVNKGFEMMGSGASSAWESLKDLEFSQAWDSLMHGAGGVKEVYGVLKDLDYSGMWHAVVNFANNISDRDRLLETAAAAATVFALGWTAKHALHFYATRGQGDTIIANWKRGLGQKMFRRFRKHPEDMLVYAGEAADELAGKAGSRPESGYRRIRGDDIVLTEDEMQTYDTADQDVLL